MKVKNYLGWLQDMEHYREGYTWHYYINKEKSICGKSKHPTQQWNAAYMRGRTCKKCLNYCKKNKLEVI